jgi:hypothetical protein
MSHQDLSATISRLARERPLAGLVWLLVSRRLGCGDLNSIVRTREFPYAGRRHASDGFRRSATVGPQRCLTSSGPTGVKPVALLQRGVDRRIRSRPAIVRERDVDDVAQFSLVDLLAGDREDV